MGYDTVPDIKMPLPGPKARAAIEADDQYISPSYTRGYPMVIVRGDGLAAEDIDGNVFLDMTAGIAVNAAGHSHPRVVKAIKDAAENFQHMSGTDFYYPVQSRLAKMLAEHTPGESQRRVFFCNSGAEAIEGSMKLARWYTNRALQLGLPPREAAKIRELIALARAKLEVDAAVDPDDLEALLRASVAAEDAGRYERALALLELVRR